MNSDSFDAPDQRHLRECYSDETLLALAKLLLAYEISCIRVTEEVLIEGTTVVRQLFKEYRIPFTSGSDKPGSATLIPVMTPSRGTVVDHLEVSAADGTRLAILGSEDTGLIATYILGLVFDAWTAELFPQASALLDEGRAALANLQADVVGLASGRSGDPEIRAALAAVRAVTDDVCGSGNHPKTERMLLRALVAFTARRPIICVDKTPLSSNLAHPILVRYRSHHTMREDSKAVKRWLRKSVGQRPYSHFIPTPHAYYTQSYYFRVDAPAGHYVSSTELVRPKNDVPSDDRYTAVDFADLPDQTYSRAGLTYAHVRVRNLPDQVSMAHRGPNGEYLRAPLGVRVVFHEIPPGSVGFALLVSLSALLTLAVVGIALSLRATQLSSDIPALLVAVPGLVGVLVGSTLEKDQLVSAPMIARISFLMTGMVCFVASMMFILSNALEKHSSHGRAAWWVLSAWWILVGYLLIQSVTLARRWNKAHRAYHDDIRFIAH